MIVKESHPMPDETIDEWFGYVANTESGTTVFIILFFVFLFLGF
jgi:hypothetical protein